MIRTFVLATAALACQATAHAQAPVQQAADAVITALTLQRCSNNDECVVKVKVFSIDPQTSTCKGGVIGANGSKLADPWLIVAARADPVITWNLDASAITGATVSFDAAKGIHIIDNNTKDDFDQPTPTPATFKWKSLNKRLRAAAYDINLVVTPTGGTPYSCKLDDPIIINRGN
jgi:hypothetical protein